MLVILLLKHFRRGGLSFLYSYVYTSIFWTMTYKTEIKSSKSGTHKVSSSIEWYISRHKIHWYI